MYKYKRIVYWSDIDNCYLVEVPDLPGCMSDGKTIEEANRNADVIIKEWLEVNAERGFPAPVPSGYSMGTFEKMQRGFSEVAAALSAVSRDLSALGISADRGGAV